ncbi:L,D-transpeptidase [Butyrivibrio sp. VCB2006]|uniref:L,D-transpeptidase n=1 Tax=Butyrivibrio sp. VCB2006 TaxID=1280679 RepID=UPI00041029A9|nr:L,D-transpeptidase [Butyrivibrio sp. VCB2006]
MKKKGLIAALICACILVVTESVYVFLSIWYEGVFPAFLWIDDIYLTGKTTKEVNQELIEKHPYDGIKVIDISGEELFISAEDIKMEYTFEPSLEAIMESRGGFKWWQTLYRTKNLASEISPSISFDENELAYRLQNWEVLTTSDNLYAQIVKGENGYEIDSNYGYKPIMENIVFNVSDYIYLSETEINLADNNGTDYSRPNYTDLTGEFENSHQDLVAEFDKINKLQSKEISFEIFSGKITVSPGDISKFILADGSLEDALAEEKDKQSPGSGLFIIGGVEKEISEEDSFYNNNGLLEDENGDLIISESKIYDYAKSIADTYTTRWCMDRYRDGESNQILIGGGDKGDGSIIDKKVLFNCIKTKFIDDSTDFASNSESASESDSEDVEDTNPLDILVKGTKEYNASEVLGDTYIEVDMNQQHLYYYVDGTLNMDMPVVTGNINRGRSTPAGVFDIYNKRYHTYLRGVDYVSYVNYWLGVNKGVGIHDANWRSEFGDEIYKTDGSHGCINCPEEKISVLWEVAEVGTPVILHY